MINIGESQQGRAGLGVAEPSVAERGTTWQGEIFNKEGTWK